MSGIGREDLERLRLVSWKDRKSRFSLKQAVGSLSSQMGVKDFIRALPDVYMAKDLKELGQYWAQCIRGGHQVHWSMGSHAIKNGLGPLIIEFIQRGWVGHLAFNSSILVHDLEIAFIGHTSEVVEEVIDQGRFGVTVETAYHLQRAVSLGKGGLGERVGAYLEGSQAPFREQSVLATAYRCGVSVSVHLAIGTDIVHLHPGFDPEAWALASYEDFLKFSTSVSRLQRGLYINMGSSVILPEVFIKALSLCRNLGYRVDHFWAVNLDFIKHYRPTQNVLKRPTQLGGRAIEILGPHELILPLLFFSILLGLDT